MENIDRRSFLKKSGVATAGAFVSSPIIKQFPVKKSLNDTINVAVIGIRSRGRHLYQSLAKIPGVKITQLCDIDQRLLPEAVAEVEKLTGFKPSFSTEYRKVLENKDIDVVTIATPNHWHALQTIWACQAGKDVFVEKPVSHTVLETEAEAVAYVVCQAMGLETTTRSSDYIQLHRGDVATLSQSLDCIQKTAALLIERLQEEPLLTT
jgi:hypothetical protein